MKQIRSMIQSHVDCLGYIDDDEVPYRIMDFVRSEGIPFYEACGAEKTVIVFKELPFVLKMVPCISINSEIEIYKNACRQGLGQFFLPVKYSFVCHGCLCYFQTKVKKHKTICSSPRYKKDTARVCYEANSKIFNPRVWDSRKTVSIIIERHGKRAAEKLTQFLVCNGVNDLHSSNVIFTGNGQVKLLDFSGYG